MHELRTEESKTEAAEMAGLRYVSDEDPGYVRQKWGQGFTYRDPEGVCVKESELRERFDGLAIPPSWDDVWICMFEDGHLQATGRDEAGRKQYIYHPEWARVRARQRFSRLFSFGERLGDLREVYDRDMRKRRLGKPRVVAAASRLLDLSHIRVGRRKYYRENETAGLVTLRSEDAYIGSRHVELTYIGKSGRERFVRVDDRRLASQLRKIDSLESTQLFAYLGRGDQVHALDAEDLNVYLEEAMGPGVTAKDFRTWGGTHVALSYLAPRPPSTDDEVEARLLEAVDLVADHLGNTRAVAREHYIAPALIKQAEAGELWSMLEPKPIEHDRLSREESRTIAWFRDTYQPAIDQQPSREEVPEKVSLRSA